MEELLFRDPYLKEGLRDEVLMGDNYRDGPIEVIRIIQ